MDGGWCFFLAEGDCKVGDCELGGRWGWDIVVGTECGKTVKSRGVGASCQYCE